MKVINNNDIRKLLDTSIHWKHLSVGQFLWAIGLHEGEGSFTFSYRGKYLQYARVKIAMSDLDVIERAKTIWEAERVGIDNSKKNCKLMYYTQVNIAAKDNNGKHIELLEIMKPYFSKRRQRQLERTVIHALAHIIQMKTTKYNKLLKPKHRRKKA